MIQQARDGNPEAIKIAREIITEAGSRATSDHVIRIIEFFAVLGKEMDDDQILKN